MNLPDAPLLHLLYQAINQAGIGSLVVLLLAGTILLSVGLTLRWISRGAQADEGDAYAYPTPALHQAPEGGGRDHRRDSGPTRGL